MGRFLDWVLGKPQETVEVIKILPTPEDLIAAKFLQSFAREFDSWTLEYENSKKTRVPGYSISEYMRTHHLYCDKVNLRMRVNISSHYYGSTSFSISEIKVNEVSMTGEVIENVFKEFIKLTKQQEKIIADNKARIAEMKKEQEKWNLVEATLGLRRTPEGALVPIEKEIPVIAPEPEAASNTNIPLNFDEESPLLQPLR